MLACATPDTAPTLADLREPNGLALVADDWLLVTNGDWSQSGAGGALVAVDIDAVEREVAHARSGGYGGLGDAAPCRRASETVECEAAAFIDGARSIQLGTGAGNIAVDRGPQAQGPLRVLIPVRDPAEVVWVDVDTTSGDLRLDCGRERGTCDAAHRAGREAAVAAEPGRVAIEDRGGRFAYVPHLLQGRLTLIALDAAGGPAVADTREEFFRQDGFEAFDAAGGYAVAAMRCDPAMPIAGSAECRRPFLVASQRFWPGTALFSVAEGLEVIVPRGDVAVGVVNPGAGDQRPVLSDLAFESDAADVLLMVQTSPPALLRADVSVDAEGRVGIETRGSVGICHNPNLLRVHERANGQKHAFVSCSEAGAVAVVSLPDLRLVKQLPAGAGTQELLIDPSREWLLVTAVRSDEIHVFSLAERDWLQPVVTLRGAGAPSEPEPDP